MEHLEIGAEEAVRSWGATLDTAIGGRPVQIQRHGRPVAVLVSHHRMEELERREQVAFDLAGQENDGEPWPPPPVR